MVDNPSHVVTDSEEKVVKKKNKCMAIKKEQLAKLHAPIRSPLSICPKSSPLLLPSSMPTPMPAPVTTPVSCPESPAVLSSYCVPTPVSCPGSPAVLSSCRMPALVSRPGSPTVLSSCCLPAPISRLGSLAVSSSCYMPAPIAFATLSLPHHTPVSCCRISALLLPLFLLGLPLFWDLYFSKYLKDPCQMSLGLVYQLALQSPFARS